MNIALVHCPITHRVFSENLRAVDEEFCVAPPISLAYIGSILERAGRERSKTKSVWLFKFLF